MIQLTPLTPPPGSPSVHDLSTDRTPSSTSGKSPTNNLDQALAHQSTTDIGNKSIVAQVTGLKRASNHTVDIDHTDQVSAGLQDDKECHPPGTPYLV